MTALIPRRDSQGRLRHAEAKPGRAVGYEGPFGDEGAPGRQEGWQSLVNAGEMASDCHSQLTKQPFWGGPCFLILQRGSR